MRLDYKKPQFLRHPIEDCVLRTTYNENSNHLRVFVRFSGEKEYEVSQYTKLFTNAILQEEEITEQEYLDF
ncbi:MAG TPA: hypothetical protein VFG54_08820 [Prolixibacteraceae bacterium]|nr:hypothetical protein [Prolixibacteraceae bacterium]